MRVKKIDIQNAVNVFGHIVVGKVKDEQIRRTLAFDYRELRKASRDIEQERSNLVGKFREEFADEWLEIQVLRNSGRPVVDHDEFLRAEAATNQDINDMFQEEAPELDLQKVSLDDFLKYVRDGEYTFEDLAVLDGIVIE